MDCLACRPAFPFTRKLPSTSMPKPLNLVVACSENRVIGRERGLPWHIPEDLAFFHDITRGQTVVLGRICYETWPKVARDGRQPVVITSRPFADITRSTTSRTNVPAGVENAPLIARSVDEALAIAQRLPGEIMVCGGQRIYEVTLPLADRLYLTLIHADVPGDTWFPEWRHLDWREVERRESQDADYRYTFSVLERQR